MHGDENKVEFVLVEAASKVEYLQSNKVDIILANFTQTPDIQLVGYLDKIQKLSMLY